MQPVKFLLVGAGARGTTYAGYALERPDEMSVVGVAEPTTVRRNQVVSKHGIAPAFSFADWREAVSADKFADAVIIATQDKLHADPAIAFAEKGYHILLEKPMAPSESECVRIIDAIKRTGVRFGVCHVMRYTHFTRRIRQMIDDGLVGDVVSVQHHHPVGFWHQAHAFVRGNWRNEAASGFMLLTKGCHDIDLLRHFVGTRCIAVSSFGSLTHFRAQSKPSNAGDRCFECDAESSCPYSAPRIYNRWLQRGETGWPLDTIVHAVNDASIHEALRTGPYGRCVYDCDNDVVDNQVVCLKYEGGRTATFTMNAFNKDGGVVTRIFGTRGEIYFNGGTGELRAGTWHMHGACLRHYDFLTDEVTEEDPFDSVDTQLTGHSNGDYHLMNHFVAALRTGTDALILSGPDVTLETHRTVFAAERSRRESRVIEV